MLGLKLNHVSKRGYRERINPPFLDGCDIIDNNFCSVAAKFWDMFSDYCSMRYFWCYIWITCDDGVEQTMNQYWCQWLPNLLVHIGITSLKRVMNEWPQDITPLINLNTISSYCHRSVQQLEMFKLWSFALRFNLNGLIIVMVLNNILSSHTFQDLLPQIVGNIFSGLSFSINILSHCGEITIILPSYLHNGKTVSLNWKKNQISKC